VRVGGVEVVVLVVAFGREGRAVFGLA